jgi:hypothetical protein
MCCVHLDGGWRKLQSPSLGMSLRVSSSQEFRLLGGQNVPEKILRFVSSTQTHWCKKSKEVLPIANYLYGHQNIRKQLVADSHSLKLCKMGLQAARSRRSV